MGRYILFTFVFLLVMVQSFGQQITFVKDSIMNQYMKSGFATKHFRPEGKEDKNKLRQGKWKDYETRFDMETLNIGSNRTEITGMFLLYGEGEFINGKREGPWKFYVIEDNTFKKIFQKEVTYKNGKKEGVGKYYFPDGKLASEGPYEGDTYTGEVKLYDENGKTYGTRQYINGYRTGKHVYYYPNGSQKRELNYVNDTLDGEYRSYYENGGPEERLQYHKGKEDGTYQYYYDNGQLWVERTYKDGLLMNVKGNYDSQGNPRDKGTLKDGNGTVKFYSIEGMLYSIQTFKDGKKIKTESR